MEEVWWCGDCCCGVGVVFKSHANRFAQWTGQGSVGLDRWKWPLGEARAAGIPGMNCRCEKTARGRSGVSVRCFFDVVGRTTNALGGE